MTDQKQQDFDPMFYDALLEFATRIGGRYISWVYEAPSEAVGRHWRNAGIELRRQVREIDPSDGEAIQAKRAELRELWATMPVKAPFMVA